MPSGVVSLSSPDLDQNGGEKTTTIVARPHLTTRHGDNSHARGASNQMVVYVRTELRVLSLCREEGRSTFGVMVGVWTKF